MLGLSRVKKKSREKLPSHIPCQRDRAPAPVRVTYPVYGTYDSDCDPGGPRATPGRHKKTNVTSPVYASMTAQTVDIRFNRSTMPDTRSGRHSCRP